MLKTLLPCCALALLSLAAPNLEIHLGSAAEARAPGPVLDLGQRSAASLMPSDSLLFVEAPGLGSILEQGLAHPFLLNLIESQLGQQLLNDGDGTPAQKLKFLDHMFGEPILAALQRASSRGIGLSLCLRDGDSATLLALHGADPESTDRTLKHVFKLLRPQGFDDQPQDLDGADLWNLKNAAVLVRQDALVLLASSRELAQEGLALARDKDAPSLAFNPLFEELMRDAEPATLRAWAHGDGLEQVDPRKFEWLDLLQHTPQGQLLLGPGLPALASSSALAMSLDLSQGDLDAELWGADIDWPTQLGPGSQTAPNAPVPLSVETPLLQATLYRDIATFLAERPDILQPRDLPKVAESLSTISLFFGGLDFGEDISPELSQWIQVISSEIEFDAGPTPAVQFPALAIVATLGNPELSGQRWNTAFQSLIGMINIDAAQKNGGRGGMLLGLSLEGETVLSHASYPTPRPGAPVDARYNLRPTCCVVGDHLIIGSHEDLVRQIVRSLDGSAASNSADTPPGEYLSLEAQPLARLIRSNQEALIMNKVVDEGVSFEEATSEIEGLALAMEAFESLELHVDYGDPSAIRARLHLGLKSAQVQ